MVRGKVMASTSDISILLDEKYPILIPASL